MKSISIREKTGFGSKTKFIIYDNFGNEFYSSNFVNTIDNGKTHLFNLPKGNYTYIGELVKLPNPVDFNKIVLPPKERNFKPKKYKISFSHNPNKCTINHVLGTITFDNAFKKAPKYILYYIYFHELGHNYYKTEKFADLYATKKMLDLGFNPSQNGRALLLSLSSLQIDRKKFHVEQLKKL